MDYSHSYKTKWHDTDACGVLRPSALLVYMQETANLQCRDWGYDLTRLHDEEGLGFLLSRIMLRVDAPLHAYEDIEVRTWCPPSKGLTFLRCFAILRDGEVVAEAVSHWAMMDLNARKLVRVSDFHREFPVGELPAEASIPARAHIPSTIDMEVVGERRIVYSDLDFNRHMNNTRYPDMVCDYLPRMDGRYVAALSLSYLREAAYGDTLIVSRSASPNATTEQESYLLRTTRADGTVCLEATITLARTDETKQSPIK